MSTENGRDDLVQVRKKAFTDDRNARNVFPG
jgi:hypothetical protein